MNVTDPKLLAAFEAESIEPSTFGHRDHVVVAFDLLRRDDFVTAAAKYAACIRGMAVCTQLFGVHFFAHGAHH